MKFSKFFSAVCVAVMTASVFSCTPPAGDNEADGTGLNDDIRFTLSVTEVTAESAKVKVTHDGERNDSWYGFVTTHTDLDSAIDAKVDELLASGKITGLKKTTSATVNLTDLEPGTDYSYVVFGLTSDGIVYGEPASVSFTTEALPQGVTYKENSAWKVRYTGVGTINGTEYPYTVTVTSSDRNKYIISAYPADVFEEYDISLIAEDAVDGLKKWLAEYNKEYNANITFDQMLYQGDGMEAYNFTSGQWRAIAVGVGADELPNGLYAVSEVFTISEGSGDDSEMTEAYAAWLGDWKFTGANGISQNVTFSKNVANESYKMTGYEGLDLEVIVTWEAEDQIWVIYNQNLGTYQFTGGATGDIWFVGEDAQENLYFSPELPICVGGMLEDGTLASLGWEGTLNMQDGSQVEYKVNDMLFLAEFTDGLSYISRTFETGYPTFPITITPKTKSLRPAKAVRMAKAAERYSEREYKVFGQHK